MQHVYVHVPFCARRCSYCDFAIAVRPRVPVGDYVEGIARELAVRADTAASGPLATLYFGGGTPSKLGGPGVALLMAVLTERYTLARNAEVTLEANPEDVTPAAAARWHQAGITRLSLGSQSFDPTVLQWMHRTHGPEAIAQAVQVARDAGIAHFSLDLIFALPAALNRDWARDLDAALALTPDHLSLYGLTLEPHTPFAAWHARGATAEASEETYEREFLLAHERLTGAGFEHYEVSNFARPGHRAVHNSAYWQGVPYLGLGPSAHGFTGTERRWNEPAYAAWLSHVQGDIPRDPKAGAEPIGPGEQSAERVYLGLRTTDGLLVTPAEQESAASWVTEGWATLSDGRLALTPNGWLRMDSLATALTSIPSA